MKTIDYIYRYDPNDPSSVKPPPADSGSAKLQLESGNELFADWMESCRTGTLSPGDARYVINCGGFHESHRKGDSEIPQQDPFAIVIGCSDARVPIEMIFGQGFNDLFVVRVAGNVLSDECWGSIDYGVTLLSRSVKLIVVLGHSGCGAVTAAVDAYLNPEHYAVETTSLVIQSILKHIFVPVRHSAKGLRAVWGNNALSLPGYRNALIESAVCLNAAIVAYNIRLNNDRNRHAPVQVLYGVYDLHSHRVNMPPNSVQIGQETAQIQLADAPTHATEFDELARLIAGKLKPS